MTIDLPSLPPAAATHLTPSSTDAGGLSAHLGGLPTVDVDPWATIEAMGRRLETLPVIEQAKGILMGTLGIDADSAFDILRQRSSHANVKLHEVARGLVAATVQHGAADRPGDEPPVRTAPV